MDLIESLGAYLGLAAFVGLAVLVLLYFQQARDVRRLREWAGRAPERTAAAQRPEPEEEPEQGPGRLERLRANLEPRVVRLREALARGFRSVDRRSPIDLRYALGFLTVAAVAAAALTTDGFGLRGDDGPEGRKGLSPPAEVEVAVLNGTGVPGLAATAGKDVEAAGYNLGVVTNTGSAFARTVIMHGPGRAAEARTLAGQLRGILGAIPIRDIDDEVRNRARDADLTLVLGADDAEL